MRGLVPKFIMLICLLHINYRPFDPCERVLTEEEAVFDICLLAAYLYFDPLSKGITNSGKVELPLQSTCLFFDTRKDKAFFLLSLFLGLTSKPLIKKNRISSFTSRRRVGALSRGAKMAAVK